MSDSDPASESTWERELQRAPLVCPSCKSQTVPEERKQAFPPHGSTWVLLVCPRCSAIIGAQRQ